MISDDLTPDDLFSCQRCGECCKGYGGTYLSEADIDRIRRFLGMKRELFIRDFCQMSGGKYLIVQGEGGYCKLWDQTCTIHVVKPRMCRRWPYIKSILVDVGNWRAMAASCPGMQVDVSDDQIRKCVAKIINCSTKFP